MHADRRPARWLRLLSLMVPTDRRTEWRDEWAAEAAHADGLRTRLAAAEDAVRLRVRTLPRAASLADLRLAARGLARTPVWTLAVVTTLGLGFGAASAMFTIVYGVMYKPLPLPDAHRLVAFPDRLTYPLYEQIAQRQTGLDSTAAWAGASLQVRIDDQPEWMSGAIVNAALLPALGVPPLLGRTSLPEEDDEHAPGSVVLSHRLWSERFGANPGVIGRSMTFGDAPVSIVGVMPATFAFPSPDVRYWRSMSAAPRSATSRYLSVGGRAKRDLSVGEATARLTGLGLEDTGAPVSLQTKLHGDVAPLLVFQAAVAALLLIACVNVTNLLTSRAVNRAGELAVRSALGAGRRHLVRLVMTEALLLAVIGGAVGIGLAAAIVRAVLSAVALPLEEQIGLDPAVVAATLTFSVAIGAVVGVIPAVRATRGDLRNAMVTGTRGSVEGGGGRRLRRALVASQVALALALVIAGGVLARSFVRLATMHPGFDTHGILTVAAGLPDRGIADQSAYQRFYGALMDRLRQVPGVADVAVAGSAPLTGTDSTGEIEVDGAGIVQTEVQTAGPGFFRTLGIPIAAGRDFQAAEPDPGVVIVNEAFANRYFPDGSALGRRVRGVWGIEDQWLTVVGVVGDIRHRGLTAPLTNQVYVPYDTAQWPWGMYVFVRTPLAEPMDLVDPIRGAVGAVEPDAPPPTIRHLSDVRDGSVADQRIATMLLAWFAVASLLLALVGTYGVVAEGVRMRRREYGIRLALGEPPGRLARHVMRDAAWTTAIGIAIGVAVSLGVGRVLEAFLAGSSPRDPVVIALAAIGLLAATLVATGLPALRAARIDPLSALRGGSGLD